MAHGPSTGAPNPNERKDSHMSSWVKRALLCAAFVAGMLALGGGVASATEPPPPGSGGGIDQTQTGSNTNDTDQSSDAYAETSQVNVNAPISILSWNSNNGDVTQSNDATTTAVAANDNETAQWIDQGQSASTDGSSCDPCGGSGDISQSQDGSNSNETTQSSSADASTSQVNVNAPISILSWGSNNGDVTQSNSADTTAVAANQNDTTQGIAQDQWAFAGGSGGSDCGCRKDGDGGDVSQSQNASNSNSTSQDADATASTEQENVNAPYSDGSVGDACGCQPSDHSVQDGCGCFGSHGDDVTQTNGASTTAVAANGNGTWQSIGQTQQAATGGSDGSYGSGVPCTCDPVHANGGDISQSQNGSNTNGTDQTANADASTSQENANEPYSKRSFGGGDVTQGNGASTTAQALNGNATGQWIDQAQSAATGGDD